MKSAIIKRSVFVGNHKTSISLEDKFWEGLKEIARSRNVTISQLVSAIDAERHNSNLSSAIRLCVLAHYAKSAA